MTDDLHIPDTGPMGLARWSATSGYQFCSCGNWHFVKLAPVPSDAAALTELADNKPANAVVTGAGTASG